MPLDPQIRLVLDNLPDNLFDVHTTTPQELRKLYAEQTTIPIFPKEPVARVEERSIPGPAGEISVRIYAPERSAERPPLVFFHGGGWVIGNLDTHDGKVRKLANATERSVVSVDYRLAPEAPFPAAAEDCFAALRWVDGNRGIVGAGVGAPAVAGDSAGGNLAAAVSLMARDRGGPALGFQLLIYPIVDCDFDRPSYTENADGYMLTRDVMMWFWDQYVPDAAGRSDPYVNVLASEDLSGLPPTHVITAEYDPLRDEGEAYAARLEAAGVPVTHTRYDGMIHGFLSFADFVDKAKQALAEAAEKLTGQSH